MARWLTIALVAAAWTGCCTSAAWKDASPGTVGVSAGVGHQYYIAVQQLF